MKNEGTGTSPPTYKGPLKLSSKASLAGAVTRRQDDAIDFREDAKVWYLYLEDAEREAKERAELWRTGLDSLLIFVSCTALLVSSRSDNDSAGWFVCGSRVVLRHRCQTRPALGLGTASTWRYTRGPPKWIDQ